MIRIRRYVMIVMGRLKLMSTLVVLPPWKNWIRILNLRLCMSLRARNVTLPPRRVALVARRAL